jgi:hypothetical protein
MPRDVAAQSNAWGEPICRSQVEEMIKISAPGHELGEGMASKWAYLYFVTLRASIV